MDKKVFIVDAFTNTKFGGNPAGVVLGFKDLTTEQMLSISKEINLSETAFVEKSNSSEYDFEVRFFTPTEEVELCGHATVATFYVLSKIGWISNTEDKTTIKQKTKAGILPVEIYINKEKPTQIMMTQGIPKYTSTIKDLHEIAEILGIKKADIGLEGFPNSLPMVVSTGLPDIILPVKNLEALKRIKPNFQKLMEYSENNKVVGVHAFTFKDYKEGIITCRNFAPAVGINEEAATGTSNGALGAYLYKNNIIKLEESYNLLCEQGIYMNRPSKINVLLERNAEDITVKVGGSAVLIIEGNIYL